MSDHIDKDRVKQTGSTPRIAQTGDISAAASAVPKPEHNPPTGKYVVAADSSPKSASRHSHPIPVDLNAEDVAEMEGLPLSFQPLQIRQSRALSIAEMDPEVNSPGEEGGNNIRLSKRLSSANRNSHRDSFKFQQSTAVAEAKFKEERDIGSKRIFHSQFYLTSIKNEEQLKAEGIDPIKQPHLRFGRPQLQQVFKDIEEMCRAESIHRVGVCVCGPAAMVSEVSDHCQSTQFAVSCDTIRFDCHKETFDF